MTNQPYSENARKAAHEVMQAKDCPLSYGDRVLDAVYPIIRADLVEEVAEAVKTWEGDSMATTDHEADLIAHIQRTILGGEGE